MRHKHADLIIAWAEGAEIEVKHDGKWTDLPPDIPPYAVTREYRIKPQPKPWYEDIPPHGVLCWVKDIKEHNPILKIIYSDGCKGTTVNDWKYATPLTDDEIKLFLRGEK